MRSNGGGLDPDRLRRAAEARVPEALALLERFAGIESPTDDPAAVTRMQAALRDAFAERGYRSRLRHADGVGPHQLFVPEDRDRGAPIQLVLGHADTVWPLGTLAEMPVERREGRLHGPGTFDMKAGIVGFLTALDVLADLGLHPEVAPVAFVNADEETGSATSRRDVARLARVATRALVLEPPQGPEGRVKTARKGMVKVHVVVHGRPAHAGLDPGAGASAISEAAHLVHALHALQDLERGVSVNVGVISGGTRPNVVAARCELRCDARTPTLDAADELLSRVRALRPTVPGTRLEIDAELAVPPLEATPRNRDLWSAARAAAAGVGIEIHETSVGGASDGNTASIHTATLDGLGWVGDGAHAPHEHVVVDRVAERVALLAVLLLLPEALR